jgi:hypothetical protein
MKAKKFIGETIINVYDKFDNEYRLTNSLLVRGLLSFNIGEITHLENRTVRGGEKYKVSKVESSISERSFLILKPKHEQLREDCSSKNTIIRKIYDLYPVE